MCCWQSQSDSEISAGINGCTVGQCKDLILKPVTLVRVAGVSRPQREIRFLPDRRCWSRAAASAAPSVRSVVQASALQPLDLSEPAAAGRTVGGKEPAPAAPDRLCARSPASVLAVCLLWRGSRMGDFASLCSAYGIVADMGAAGNSRQGPPRRPGGRRRRRRRAPVSHRRSRPAFKTRSSESPLTADGAGSPASVGHLPTPALDPHVLAGQAPSRLPADGPRQVQKCLLGRERRPPAGACRSEGGPGVRA